MECPVCHYKEISEGNTTCPDCNSDLEAFDVLKRIKKRGKRKKTYLIICIILIILLVAALVLAIIFMRKNSAGIRTENGRLKEQVEQLHMQNDKIQTEKKELETKVAELNEKLRKANKPRTIEHLIKRGETLYLIAQKYYGDGWKYPKIACDNNIPDPDFIIAGHTLTIYK